MKGTIQLACRYVAYHKYKSLLLVFCISLTTLLPICLAILLANFNTQIVARATSTPLVLGAKGSRIDLVMHALYFKTKSPGTIRLSESQTIEDQGTPIPLLVRATAKKIPVVGTTLEYFNLRGLQLARGSGLTRLGDCVLGSEVARRLQLEPGKSLLTDRENILDFAGRYPLNMRVNGILLPTKTADDNVIFVDLKTAWIIEGLGHGHQDLTQEQDDLKILARDQGSVTASAAVLPYTQITEENIGSFHFHGDTNEFPVTAIIAVPPTDKAEALLMGRFQRDDATAQLSQPSEVVSELMSLVFRVQKFFNANAVLIAFSTFLLLVLVILLSIRLRQSEMTTMFKIGCRRRTMASLICGELFIIFVCAAGLVTVLSLTVNFYATEIVQTLLVNR